MIAVKKINLNTTGNTDIIDITPQVEQVISEAGIKDGVVNLFVSGSTAGITTIEYESGLLSDFQKAWERIAPGNASYNHDSRWGDGNGFSHVRASLLGASLVVPFSNKQLMLGTWQQIVVVDFDNRPRSRQIIAQVMGE